MKYEITNTIDLKITLNSSEAVMFTKGGRHNVILYLEELKRGYKFVEDEDFDKGEKINISVQIDPEQRGMFNHVTSTKFKMEEKNNET